MAAVWLSVGTPSKNILTQFGDTRSRPCQLRAAITASAASSPGSQVRHNLTRCLSAPSSASAAYSAVSLPNPPTKPVEASV